MGWAPERFREWPGIDRDDCLSGGSVHPYTHLQKGGLTMNCYSSVVSYQEHRPVDHEGEGVPQPPPVLGHSTGEGGEASQPQASPGREECTEEPA